jgi:RimJ/RimL family protein N-acetyltransferase
MLLDLREAASIQATAQRKSWVKDPQVNQYLVLRDKPPRKKRNPNLTNFEKFYEIYELEKHVGDIKVFYETEEDILNKRAQILMVVGKRNHGIGTKALNILLDRMKEKYNSVYCVINRSNIASLKMLKRTGFEIEKLDRNKVILSRPLP